MDESDHCVSSPNVFAKLQRSATTSIIELQKRREEIALFDPHRTATEKEPHLLPVKSGGLTSTNEPLNTNPSVQHGASSQGTSQAVVWKTGIWTRLPILAALSLLGVLACKDKREQVTCLGGP